MSYPVWYKMYTRGAASLSVWGQRLSSGSGQEAMEDCSMAGCAPVGRPGAVAVLAFLHPLLKGCWGCWVVGVHARCEWIPWVVLP